MLTKFIQSHYIANIYCNISTLGKCGYDSYTGIIYKLPKEIIKEDNSLKYLALKKVLHIHGTSILKNKSVNDVYEFYDLDNEKKYINEYINNFLKVCLIPNFVKKKIFYSSNFDISTIIKKFKCYLKIQSYILYLANFLFLFSTNFLSLWICNKYVVQISFKNMVYNSSILTLVTQTFFSIKNPWRMYYCNIKNSKVFEYIKKIVNFDKSLILYNPILISLFVLNELRNKKAD